MSEYWVSSTKPAKMVRHTCSSFAVLAEADAIITHGHTEYRRPRSMCSSHIGSQESPVRHARSRFVAPETGAKRRCGKGKGTEKYVHTIRTVVHMSGTQSTKPVQMPRAGLPHRTGRRTGVTTYALTKLRLLQYSRLARATTR